MSQTSSGALVRQAVADASDTDANDWYLVSKARHALHVVLAAGAEYADPTGTVITQPFTCLTAVAPILSAGLQPVYADIDADTLTIDPDRIPSLTTSSTRALIAQHTFGAAAPVARLRAAIDPGVLVVEDSAHCLGELGRDEQGNPAADVSVHSFGVEKILPTRAGAAVWVNPDLHGRDPVAHARITAALRDLPQPGAKAALAHRVGNPVRRITARMGRPGALLLDRLAAAGLADVAIMPAERSGNLAGQPSALAGAALAAVSDAIPSWRANAAHRREITALYAAGLSGLSWLKVPAALADPSLTLVRYPLLVQTPERAEKAFDALADHGLVPGRWYRPTLFPGPSDLDAFGYDPQTCPVAEDASARILNLQTAPFVTPEAAARTISVLRSLG